MSNGSIFFNINSQEEEYIKYETNLNALEIASENGIRLCVDNHCFLKISNDNTDVNVDGKLNVVNGNLDISNDANYVVSNKYYSHNAMILKSHENVLTSHLEISGSEIRGKDPAVGGDVDGKVSFPNGVNALNGVLTGGASHTVTGGGGPAQQFNNVFRGNANIRAAAFVSDATSHGASVWWTDSNQNALGAIDGVNGGGLAFFANSGSGWTRGMEMAANGNVSTNTTFTCNRISGTAINFTSALYSFT